MLQNQRLNCSNTRGETFIDIVSAICPLIKVNTFALNTYLNQHNERKYNNTAFRLAYLEKNNETFENIIK
jgi:hypothetical protein